MSEGKKGKKRPKSYYRKCAAGGKRSKPANELDAGMKGFLITCNKYERETVREMYNVLNEYADKMYGPEKLAEEVEDENSDSDEDDMEKAMAKEKTALIKQATGERRFQNTDTKFKNLIFIRTSLEDPCQLAHKLFTDMYESKTQRARYAQRMIPVTEVCKAQMKNIEPLMRTVLKPDFDTPFGVGLRYTSVCKIRNNNNVQRVAILPLIGSIVQEMNPQHRLCHDDPELVIVIEVIRNNCCVSVLKDYFKYRKYNFHEVVKNAQEDNDDEAVVKKTDKESGDAVGDLPEVKDDDNIISEKQTTDSRMDDAENCNEDKSEINTTSKIEGVKENQDNDQICKNDEKMEETVELKESENKKCSDVAELPEADSNIVKPPVLSENTKNISDVDEAKSNTEEELDSKIGARDSNTDIVT